MGDLLIMRPKGYQSHEYIPNVIEMRGIAYLFQRAAEYLKWKYCKGGIWLTPDDEAAYASLMLGMSDAGTLLVS